MQATEKQSVALISMGASLVLAVAKLAAGLVTGSLGILSEAIHSILDFGSTVITWFAVRYSDQPPDEEHHYGHHKAESVAALVETGLLFLTTGWIVWEALSRLWGGGHEVDITWWAVVIVAASVVIDFNRARALKRVAEKTSSDALEADALHFSSDMWSSIVVLIGLGAVWYGLPAADAIAALVVSAFVGLAGWRLGQRTLATLLDQAPEGATDKVRRLVNEVPGVLRLKSLRIRPAGPTLFVSIVVEVARTMPVDDIVALKQSILDRVQELYPQADITMAANPVALDNETVFQKVMLIASQRATAIHHLTVQHIGDRLSVSFDLEVPGETPLKLAHDKASGLEAAIRRELGPRVEVETHIEPQPEVMLEGVNVRPSEYKTISARLMLLASRQKRLRDVHNVRVRRTGEGLFVHYHCRFKGDETVDTVHTAVDHIENGLQAAFPKIRRVIAHAEPLGHPRHDL
jgi:cation diffusion facilitator family transporter